MFLLSAIISFKLLAQTDIAPVTYDNYFLNPGFINPAIIAPEARFEARLNQRILIGPFNNVNSSLVQGTMAIKKQDNKPEKYVGLIFQTEKEGKFLSRTRFYGLYAIKIPLKTNLYLNAGAAFGALNYAIQSSTSNAGGSALAVDGKVGTWIHSNTLSVGLSINQIFNNTFEPFAASVRLKRFFSLYGNFKHQFNENFDINMFYTSNLYGSRLINNSYSLNAVVGMGRVLQAGAGFRLYQGGVAYAGLRNIDLGRKKLQIGFTYFIPLYQLLSINNVAEFSIVLQ